MDEKKTGNAKFLHSCNLVFIKVDNDSGMQFIPTYKFGENIKFENNVSAITF